MSDSNCTPRRRLISLSASWGQHASLISPLGGHGIVSISHGDNLGIGKNALASELSAGIRGR